jgi:hypothetical protein
MAIAYRTTGPWGSGQAGNLTPPQVDENFFTLDQRVAAVENNPPTAISIESFVVEGTLLTIVLTNGAEHGPFVLPVAQWRWTGMWQPITQYFVGDIVEDDGSLYFIRVQHISGAAFDPDLFGPEGQVYVLMIAKASQPYDIGMFFNDEVRAGEDLLMIHVAVRSFTIPVNFAGSQAWLERATSASAITLPVYKNLGEVVGTITFTPGALLSGSGQFGVFNTLDAENPISLAATDRISIGQSYEDDPTAAFLSVTIVGATPSL